MQNRYATKRKTQICNKKKKSKEDRKRKACFKEKQKSKRGNSINTHTYCVAFFCIQRLMPSKRCRNLLLEFLPQQLACAVERVSVACLYLQARLKKKFATSKAESRSNMRQSKTTYTVILRQCVKKNYYNKNL